MLRGTAHEQDRAMVCQLRHRSQGLHLQVLKTGTGKEGIATEKHQDIQSPTPNPPLVCIHCSQNNHSKSSALPIVRIYDLHQLRGKPAKATKLTSNTSSPDLASCGCMGPLFGVGQSLNRAVAESPRLDTRHGKIPMSRRDERVGFKSRIIGWMGLKLVELARRRLLWTNSVNAFPRNN